MHLTKLLICTLLLGTIAPHASAATESATSHIPIVLADQGIKPPSTDKPEVNAPEAPKLDVKTPVETKSHTVPSPITPANFKLNTFRPIDPMATFTYTTLGEIKDGKPAYVSAQFPAPTATNNDAINALLPNFSALVATYKFDSSLGVTYGPASLAANKGSYKVILDYVKYREEPILDSQNNYICQGRVGVGIRMIAEVKTTKADLNLGSLLAIGVAAKAGHLSGTLYVDVIGISSKEVNSLVPMSSVIDETSIQSALQALAAIKSKIFDAETKLSPHIIAVNLPLPKKCECPAAKDPKQSEPCKCSK